MRASGPAYRIKRSSSIILPSIFISCGGFVVCVVSMVGGGEFGVVVVHAVEVHAAVRVVVMSVVVDVWW